MKGRLTRFSVLYLVFAFLFSVCATHAQVLTGTITGSVTDPQNLPIPQAKVIVVDLSIGQEYNSATDDQGNFTITNLPYSFYRVTIEVQGFAKFTAARVQVNVGQTSVVMAKLELAKAGTEIIVRGEQTPVQTETAEIKNSIDRRQILELPLPTRNPLDLVRTMAGAAAPTVAGIGDVFVHGLRGNSTNIVQDGVNVADNFVKTSSFFAISAPTVDTVGEFTVSTAGSGTDAGFGATQVGIVTARGSNALRGSVFWFQRTSYLNANTYFNNFNGQPTPFQLQNRIGYNVGGPVYVPKIYNGKNKTWFFNAFEAFREPRQQARNRTVLTSDARTGMFSYVGSTDGQLHTLNLLRLIPGATPVINTAVMNFYNGLVPPPNATTGCTNPDIRNIGCFLWNIKGSGFTNRYTARIDHQLTSKHAIEFVYNQANFKTAEDFLNGIERNFPNSATGGQESKRQVFTWALHSAFGANKTNTARFGLQRAPVTFTHGESYAATGGFQIVTPGSLTDPTITSTNLPQGRNTPVRQVTDNFSWVRGAHAMEFGGEYRQIVAKSFFFNVVVPRVSLGFNTANPDGLVRGLFPGGISDTDLSNAQVVFDTVTGLLSQVQQGFNHTSPTSGYVPRVPRTIDPIQNNLAFYAKDTWKVFPNLSLQYGMRWEYQGVFDLRNKLILQPDDRLGGVFGPAGVNNFFSPVSTPATSDVLLNFAGGGNGKPLYDRVFTNFGPFIGFAWDPFRDKKTAVRGGFAIHYTQDGFTLFQVGSTLNSGLFTVVTNSNPTGVFNPSSVPTPAVPPDVFPVSQKANFAASNTTQLWVFKKDLATPYVEEWNFAIQREVGERITLEARYIGNRAVKLYRSTDINELNLFNSPFSAGGATVPNILAEFKNAQNNLNICLSSQAACKGAAGVTSSGTFSNFRNWGLSGQVPLPILQTLFSGLSPTSGSGFSNSTFVNTLNQNNIGLMFDTLRRSPTYATNRGQFPLNFFVPNPWASQSVLVDNSSWSNYHALELEARRRFASGLFFQVNYTWGKALTDARFLTSQQEFQAYRSLGNRKLDKNRAQFDITHTLAANYIYPLPFGKGQRFASGAGALLDKLVGGWSLLGLTYWNSGSPFTIQSGRLTTGSRGFLETAVLRNMTPRQLQKFIGVFKTPNGVFWLDPNSGLLTITGKTSKPVLCTAGQTTPCFDTPAPGEFGNMPILGFNGPSFLGQDLSIHKKIPIPRLGERFNIEIRLEAFNVLNHPTFVPGQASTFSNLDNQTITRRTADLQSTQFGQTTSVVDTSRGGGVNSRNLQWGIRVNF